MQSENDLMLTNNKQASQFPNTKSPPVRTSIAMAQINCRLYICKHEIGTDRERLCPSGLAFVFIGENRAR
ncbi:hypothetical protein PGTUg99_009406 [Puccinia graminis f. sp. tritici]|uniref:Uncharacterized protein n=1 Tax=Puccinia graminis f. sp. tritici TaxID=56615 RepID=A0A5B0RCU9_PUCGR|nr:hypothetical protein PGTUg99_009406 [Puccinia graminis f. sp. tritici]